MTTQADTNRTALRYQKEASWRQPPLNALKEMRFTAEALGTSRGQVTSDSIRSDRQLTDIIPVSFETQGDIQGEFTAGDWDDFLEGAFESAWESLSETDNDTDAEAATGSDDAALKFSGSSAVNAVYIGQQITISGFSDDANNQTTVVTGKDETNNRLYVSATLVAEPSATVSLSGKRLKNGVTPVSYYIEKEFADVGKFMHFDGMQVSEWQWSYDAGNKVLLSFMFLGGEMETSEAAKYTSLGTYQKATDNEIVNANEQVSELRVGGMRNSVIRSFQGRTMNNLRLRPAIGTKSTVGIGSGRFEVGGSLTAYFTDFDLYEKFLESETSSILTRIADRNGNSYTVYLPTVKYVDAQIMAGGINQDVMVNLSWQALRSPDLDLTLLLSRNS